MGNSSMSLLSSAYMEEHQHAQEAIIGSEERGAHQHFEVDQRRDQLWNYTERIAGHAQCHQIFQLTNASRKFLEIIVVEPQGLHIS